jgi:hypothetical protein
MTGLLLCGQDIRSISVGLVRDGKLLEARDCPGLPETYLASVEQTLKAWKLGLTDLDAIAVVTGPGSFTALRVSTTIANAIAFARNIPVVSVENPSHLPLRELVSSIDWSVQGQGTEPAYDKPPHITRPNPR